VKNERKKWSNVSADAISLASIRELHVPSEHYRFTEGRYPSGASFAGTIAAPVVIYVLEGGFTHTINGASLTLKAGEFAEFGPCHFACDVKDESGVHYVRVIEIPEKFRRASVLLP
jgi:quercetin dioxygenase-like cupin family protein